MKGKGEVDVKERGERREERGVFLACLFLGFLGMNGV